MYEEEDTREGLPEGTDGFAIEHAPWCDDFFQAKDYNCPNCNELLEAIDCQLKCSRCRAVLATCGDL